MGMVCAREVVEQRSRHAAAAAATKKAHRNGVRISNRKSVYLFTIIPTKHTYTF